jgi:tetratricopeptide (TPR) repeat protein
MRFDYRPTPDRVVLFGLILSAAIYCRDLRYNFVLDDLPLILLNETFASWRNWSQLFATHILSSASVTMLSPGAPAAHYRPIYMLWLMVNTRLFGASPPWLHLSSIVLHMLVVFLVYKLASKMFDDRWAAVLAALLFALHPIHVESVAYISASADILAAFFLLISFLSYMRFREEGRPAVYLLVSLLSAVLAMLSKETGAMLPWLLVAYESLRTTPPSSSPRWKGLLWTLPYFAVVAAYALARTALVGRTLGPGSAEHKLSALWNIPLIFLVYLRNLLWPFHLSFFYPTEWTSQWTIVRAAFFALTAVAVIWLWKRYSQDGAGRLELVWTAILFVPALAAVFVFINDDWVHDRHMYLASIPFCMLIAGWLTHPPLPRRTSIAASAVLVGIFSMSTFFEVPRFEDELALYQSAMKVAPNSISLHGYYSLALLNYGRVDEALREFQKTTVLWPRSPDAHESYAAALSRAGREQEAAVEFQKALQCAPAPSPFRAFVLYRLASIELEQAKVVEATAHLQEATRIDPEQLNYHATLAAALRRQGLIQEADVEVQREAIVRAAYLRKHSAPSSQVQQP